MLTSPCPECYADVSLLSSVYLFDVSQECLCLSPLKTLQQEELFFLRRCDIRAFIYPENDFSCQNGDLSVARVCLMSVSATLAETPSPPPPTVRKDGIHPVELFSRALYRIMQSICVEISKVLLLLLGTSR